MSSLSGARMERGELAMSPGARHQCTGTAGALRPAFGQIVTATVSTAPALRIPAVPATEARGNVAIHKRFQEATATFGRIDPRRFARRKGEKVEGGFERSAGLCRDVPPK